MAASSHEWDHGGHEWDHDSESDGPGWESSSDDEISWENMTSQQAGDELAERRLSMLNRGSLSAKAVCTLALFATKAGAQGFVKSLYFNPDVASGHFQRHIDSALQCPMIKRNCTS